MPKPNDGTLSDEAVHLCQPALYVEPLNCPIEEIKYARNGHEHIHLARQETLALFPDADFSQSMPMFHCTEAATAVDDDAKPFNLKKWKNDQAYSFSRLALDLKKKRSQLMKKFQQQQFPPVENEKDVFLFCLGSELYKKMFKDENVNHLDGHQPVMSIILFLSQEEILVVLGYLSKWSKQLKMTDSICGWIYSLLTCLHKPVSDMCEEFLEDFHDECVQQLKNCDKEEKQQLHLITAILKKYFCVKSYQIGPSLDSFSKLC